MINSLQIPSGNLPIFIIGAGGIVNTAHLPAYKLAGFNVQGIVDVLPAKAKQTAENFGIPHIFLTVEEMIAQVPADAVFDVAVPGSQTIPLLNQLPEGSSVLLQKPMGENFGEAKKILQLAREKNLRAAINFQLRYAPYILAAKDLIQSGQLGDLNDIEVNVSNKKN